MKWSAANENLGLRRVILRVRMWIEIFWALMAFNVASVILRVRMWIEIELSEKYFGIDPVILRVRMWIEIGFPGGIKRPSRRHPPCEDVD